MILLQLFDRLICYTKALHLRCLHTLSRERHKPLIRGGKDLQALLARVLEEADNGAWGQSTDFQVWWW